MLDNDLPSDVERYEKWVNDMQGRNYNFGIFTPTKYSEYQTMRAMVDDLYSKKNYGYNYQKNKPEIRKMIAEVVSMVMFIKEELN